MGTARGDGEWLAPTFVNTELIRHVYERPDFRDQILARIPLGRIANPKDVVAPVLFLAAPGAEFITGQVLYVDGGITASQVFRPVCDLSTVHVNRSLQELRGMVSLS